MGWREDEKMTLQVEEKWKTAQRKENADTVGRKAGSPLCLEVTFPSCCHSRNPLIVFSVCEYPLCFYILNIAF